MKTATLLDAALFYAGRGWSVFPLRKGSKKPLTEHGLLDATTDTDLIRRWWRRWPAANVGIACGPSGIVALDVDPENGGKESWAELRQMYDISEETATQLTGGGGIHLVYLMPDGAEIRNSAGKLGNGLDVRGNGGYIVAAPSIHESGQMYQWEIGYRPDEVEILPLPDVLVALLKVEPGGDSGNGARPADGPVVEGARNDTLFRIGCAMRRWGASQESIESALLNENSARCNPPLGAEEVQKIAMSAARYKPAESSAMPPAGAGMNGAGKRRALLEQGADDEGNAQTLHYLYGDQFLYCEALGWLRYTGTHWSRDGAQGALDEAAVDTIKQRRTMASAVEREAIVKFCSPSKRKVRDCQELFKRLVEEHIGSFDRHPDMLNCQNGVVNLRTGELSPHDPEQRFTYCIPVEFDLHASWNEWESFLDQVIGGGATVREYIQVAIGYSLTGHTREESLWYVYGPTRSGKGTFTETLLTLLPNPLGIEVDFATFTAKRDADAQNFDLAHLKPARLIIASESNKYQSLNVGKIKSLTGGNWIRAAFKHRDHFQYRPQFKIWLVSNHPVNADVEDDAAWNRVKVVEFPHSYAGKEDKSLKERMKHPDVLKGVLAWAVIGATKWFAAGASGLQTPEAVQIATQQHRDEMDYVQAWLDESCEDKRDDPEAWLSNERIYLSYENWCKQNGITPKHQRSLLMGIKSKGYTINVAKWDAFESKTKKGVSGLTLL